MKEALLETLLEQCRAGKRADSGFKKEAWVEVVRKVQGVIRQSLLPILTVAQYKSKADQVSKEELYYYNTNTIQFKSMQKEWNTLSNQSGFGFDKETDLFTAPNDVWTKYLAVSLTY